VAEQILVEEVVETTVPHQAIVALVEDLELLF